MRLAVIADIHGNLTALNAVLSHLDTSDQPDQIWVLGDLASHGAQPAECVTVIRERHEANKETFRVIGGNADRYLVTNERMARPAAKDADTYQTILNQFHAESAILDWGRSQLGWENYEFLSKLIGREIWESVEGYGIVLGYHAIPGNDEYNITPDTPDEEALDSVLDRPIKLGLYGHIHRQVDRDLKRVRLVNPGSVGMSFEKPGFAQYALLTFTDGAVSVAHHNIPYDVSAVLALAKDAGHPAVDFLEKALKEVR